MRRIDQIKTKEELLSVFSIIPPISECSFLLSIDSKEEKLQINLSNKDLIITALSIPQLGIIFSQSAEALGYNAPQVDYTALEVSFLCKSTDGGLNSPIHTLYNNQFNKTGTLKFIPASRKPDITIKVVSGDKEFIVATLLSCSFSCPVPTVNLDSTGASVFRTTITYKSIVKK